MAKWEIYCGHLSTFSHPTMDPLITLPAALGGRSALKPVPKTTQDWHELLQKGLPPTALLGFKAVTSMSDLQLADLLGVSVKTLQRARASDARLDTVTSDRLFRAARIVALAAEVMESGARGLGWLTRAQIGLGGRSPLSLMTTEAGCQEVERLLTRIDHGVYS